MSHNLTKLVEILLKEVAACKAVANELDLELQLLPSSTTATPQYVPLAERVPRVPTFQSTFAQAPRSVSPEPWDEHPHVRLQLAVHLSPSPSPSPEPSSKGKRDASELSTTDDGRADVGGGDSSRSETPVEERFARRLQQRLM